MDARKVYAGKFLKAADLPGRRVQTRIQAVTLEEFSREGSAPDQKLVLRLRGISKLLVLNKTNFSTLIDICQTTETDDWVGQPIVLAQAKVMFQGKTSPTIRIEEPGTETAPPEPGADEEPNLLADEM